MENACKDAEKGKGGLLSCASRSAPGNGSFGIRYRWRW